MTDAALRQRLLPAICMITTGQMLVGKRGMTHHAIAETNAVPDCHGGEYGVGTIYVRGFYDPHTKHWFHFTEIDGIHDINESDKARTIREMRS